VGSEVQHAWAQEARQRAGSAKRPRSRAATNSSSSSSSSSSVSGGGPDDACTGSSAKQAKIIDAVVVAVSPPSIESTATEPSGRSEDGRDELVIANGLDKPLNVLDETEDVVLYEYQCDYCTVTHKSFASSAQHENSCAKNPINFNQDEQTVAVDAATARGDLDARRSELALASDAAANVARIIASLVLHEGGVRSPPCTLHSGDLDDCEDEDGVSSESTATRLEPSLGGRSKDGKDAETATLRAGYLGRRVRTRFIVAGESTHFEGVIVEHRRSVNGELKQWRVLYDDDDEFWEDIRDEGIELLDSFGTASSRGVTPSRFHGVSWEGGFWQVRIAVGVDPIGHFDDEFEAARAYDAYIAAHSIGAPLNFP
jgi:hypothetical protein